jgi:hypothetical protein
MQVIRILNISRINLLIIALFLVSCGGNIDDEQDYYKWLNNEAHGLIKTRKINGFSITMKYLPADLLVYNQCEQASKSKRDSLLARYKNGYTFLFTITDDIEDTKSDIIFYNVYSEEEFKIRFSNLHFNIGQYIWINYESEQYFPVLSIMENTYNLKQSRSFYLVFSDKDKLDEILKMEKVDIVFNDIFFETGISHFIFKKNDLESVPSIGFWH